MIHQALIAVCIAYGPVVIAQFDGPTTVGDYVTSSRTLAGAVHDAGPERPKGVVVLGCVLQTTLRAGDYPVRLDIDPETWEGKPP